MKINLYRCSGCGNNFEYVSSKAWIRAYCGVIRRVCRLYRVRRAKK